MNYRIILISLFVLCSQSTFSMKFDLMETCKKLCFWKKSKPKFCYLALLPTGVLEEIALQMRINDMKGNFKQKQQWAAAIPNKIFNLKNKAQQISFNYPNMDISQDRLGVFAINKNKTATIVKHYPALDWNNGYFATFKGNPALFCIVGTIENYAVFPEMFPIIENNASNDKEYVVLHVAVSADGKNVATVGCDKSKDTITNECLHIYHKLNDDDWLSQRHELANVASIKHIEFFEEHNKLALWKNNDDVVQLLPLLEPVKFESTKSAINSLLEKKIVCKEIKNSITVK